MLFRFLALVTTPFIDQRNLRNREPAAETLHDIIFTYFLHIKLPKTDVAGQPDVVIKMLFRFLALVTTLSYT